MGIDFVDKQLVEQAQGGDKKAFDLLVLKYQQRIINLISRFHYDDAQDIAQEAFIKAYKALPHFRGESAFYTWMYRIAVNTAKNYLAVKSKRPLELSRDQINLEQLEDSLTLKEQQTPDGLLASDDLQAVIWKAIEALPKDLKIAITLREIEGLSYEDIAFLMECPIGTVRSRIFRAREAIDKAIKPLLTK